MATETEAAAANPEEIRGRILARAQTWVRQRWLYATAAALVFGGVVFALLEASAASYVPVARELLPEDQQAAVAALDAKQIPYRLTSTGIDVPEERLYEARMELATNGSMAGKIMGFELFDNNTVGRSSFSQKVNFRRAMEGELSRTIGTLKSVDRARVHLVLPERRLFKRDQSKPTASVVVTLKRGMLLSQKQVNAVQQLVGGAVEGLAPSQVAVVDQFGQVLARADNTDDAKIGQMIEKTASYERKLEDRVVALLEPTIGRGRVRVKVAAQLDFSKVQEHQEQFDPESQTVRSEREKLEKTEGSARPARGIPGTTTNLPTRAPQPPEPLFTRPSKADRSDTTKNYVVDRKITQRQLQSPRVDKLSLAVVIDVIRKDDGTVERPHTATEIAAYTKLLTRAVGLDTGRGDTIEVASMPFTDLGLDVPPVVEVPEEMTWTGYLMYALAGLGVIVLIIILLLVARAKRKAKESERLAEAERIQLLEAERAAEAAKAQMAEIGLQQEIAQLRERAVTQSERDVLVTASVIRSWLNTKKRAS